MVYKQVKKISKMINLKSLMTYNILNNSIFSIEMCEYIEDIKINENSLKNNKVSIYDEDKKNNSSSIFKNYNDSILKVKNKEYPIPQLLGGSLAQFSVIENDKEFFFCKRLNVKSNDEITLRRTLTNQYSLNHENICKIIDIIRKNLGKNIEYFILTRYCAKGDLYDFLDTDDTSFFNTEEYKDNLNRFAYQIINAIHYCHEKGIYHRDIKPENFIINNNNNVELVDFDYSNKKKTAKRYYGTDFYSSPEIIYCEGITTRNYIHKKIQNLNLFEILNKIKEQNENIKELKIKKENIIQELEIEKENSITKQENNIKDIYIEKENIIKEIEKDINKSLIKKIKLKMAYKSQIFINNFTNINIQSYIHEYNYNKKGYFFYNCEKNDMYSLGCTLYKMFYRENIDLISKFSIMFNKFHNSEYLFKKKFYGHEKYKKSIDLCIKGLIFYHESSRPSIKDVLESSFYQNLKQYSI